MFNPFGIDANQIPEHEGSLVFKCSVGNLFKDKALLTIFDLPFKSNSIFTLVRDDDNYLKFIRKNPSFGSRITQIHLEDFVGLTPDEVILIILTWSKEDDKIYFGDSHKLASSFGEVSDFNIKKQPIKDSSDLMGFAQVVINNRLKHEIEHRNLYEPFWENIGKSNMKPRSEIQMQSTIRSLMISEFEDVGISLTKESDEGIGSLDFKCTYNNNNVISKVHIEVKLAHSNDILNGIKNQLPMYMNADKCTYGIYLVLWFNDGKHFNEPKGTIEDLKAELFKIRNEITDKNIEPVIIDTTKKISASKKK